MPVDEAGGHHVPVRRDGRRHPRVSRVPDRGDLRSHLAREADRPTVQSGRQGRIRRQPEDQCDRPGIHPALRHADGLSARDEPLPGHSFAVTLVELPLVLPPAVAGVGLLVAFGHVGLLGSSLDLLGISLPFTQSAVTIAVAYVASPLYIRQAIAAFEATDPNLTAASRTLGAGPARTFFRIVLPLARGGLIAGLALSFARGLGEFGATIMFAGSLQHVTQTLPLAIYAEFDRNFDATLAMSGVLVIISIILLLGLRIGLTWQGSSSKRSLFLFGPSASS